MFNNVLIPLESNNRRPDPGHKLLSFNLDTLFNPERFVMLSVIVLLVINHYMHKELMSEDLLVN